MEEGKILQIASPAELRASPASGFVRDFLTDVEEGD
jgi:ABC-type proline/glycine betaine transport system ATPase subunit